MRQPLFIKPDAERTRPRRKRMRIGEAKDE